MAYRSSSGSLAGAVNWLLGRNCSAEATSADKCNPAAVWTPLAKHLQRIAGNQASLSTLATPLDHLDFPNAAVNCSATNVC